MEVFDALPAAGAIGGPTAVTIGVFDGMHAGHRALVARTRERAGALGAKAVALSFREHPDLLLSGSAPPVLQSLDDRVEALDATGLDALVLLTFDARLRDTEPAAFAQDVLVDALACRALVLGFDSAICKGRSGTVERFAELGGELGFGAERVERVEVDGGPVSSSRIRELLASGELEAAERMLGRPHRVRGQVVRGEGRGRGLGFPTANVDTGNFCLPTCGVYALRARVGEHVHGAVANLGWRPTFGEADAPGLEVHLLDFDGDVYGAEMAVDFIARLRGERRFASADELKRQIEADRDEAAALLERGSGDS